MAITNFIPTIWSENLLTALDQQYIGVAHCNRDFEGDIKGRGASVKICGVGNITVGDYTKNTDMSSPETLSDTMKELTISEAKYFNFQVDDIDRVQCNPKLLDAAMKNAADALAVEAEKFIYTTAASTSNSFTYTEGEAGCSLIDTLLDAREFLYENGVTDAEEVVIELSPKIATMLLREASDKFSYNNTFLETGCIGTFAGCKVYVSNNIYYDSGVANTYYGVMRTKRAIAFAEQLSEVEAYRPEKRFADAIKGLHLYGTRVIYPNELLNIIVEV